LADDEGSLYLLDSTNAGILRPPRWTQNDSSGEFFRNLLVLTQPVRVLDPSSLTHSGGSSPTWKYLSGLLATPGVNFVAVKCAVIADQSDFRLPTARGRGPVQFQGRAFSWKIAHRVPIPEMLYGS